MASVEAAKRGTRGGGAARSRRGRRRRRTRWRSITYRRRRGRAPRGRGGPPRHHGPLPAANEFSMHPLPYAERVYVETTSRRRPEANDEMHLRARNRDVLHDSAARATVAQDSVAACPFLPSCDERGWLRSAYEDPRHRGDRKGRKPTHQTTRPARRSSARPRARSDARRRPSRSWSRARRGRFAQGGFAGSRGARR